MDRHARGGLALLFVVVLLSACPDKKPAGPPPELLSQIQAAEAEFQADAVYQPGASDTAKYQKLIAEARQLLEAGDYPGALDRARRAELEAVLLHGRMVYDKLMKTNPSTNLTYNYRQSLKKSEDAERTGDLAAAVNFAREALDQISQVASGQGECQKVAEQKLALIKKDLEGTYRAPRELELAYWDLKDEIPTGDCDKINQMITALKKKIEFFKGTNISTTPMFIVSAPPDYVKQFGDPWMYREVTPEGFLDNRLIQVATGAPVMFIKSMLFSRDKTLYYVRDTRSGREGWMAEERVWPDRSR